MSLDAMNLDPSNGRPDELALLRQRVDRLEREVAELRGVRSLPIHLSHDETVAKVGHPEVVAAPPPLLINLPPVVLSAPAPRASLESRLGSQIFNRIAIVALLIGTAYGLKLAIDNGLLGDRKSVV